MIIRPNIANMHAEGTPPDSPTHSSSEPTMYLQVTQELVDKLQLLVPTKNVVEGSSKVEITQVPASNLDEARSRASRVEFKSVNEVYAIPSDYSTMLMVMTSQLGQESFQLHNFRTSDINKR